MQKLKLIRILLLSSIIHHFYLFFSNFYCLLDTLVDIDLKLQK